MGQPIIQVDAFTDRAVRGQPGRRLRARRPRRRALDADVAREMNLSETAFLHREGGSGAFRLRWFTPDVEVDLCGHATLATAHVLWNEGHLPPDIARLVPDPERPPQGRAPRRLDRARLPGDPRPVCTPGRPADADALAEIARRPGAVRRRSAGSTAWSSSSRRRPSARSSPTSRSWPPCRSAA